MREIKFRAQDIANNKWVYGFFVCMRDTGRKPIDKRERITHRIYSGIADSCASEIGYDFFGDWTEVNPNTVGQFTGMYDKNGKEIYEGDILKIFYHGKSKVFGIAKYKDTRFYIDDNWNIDHSSSRPMNEMFDRYEFEVIGNAYDNPELLKEDEKNMKGK